MPWIIKSVTRLETDTQDRIEYFGSDEADEARALARVRHYVPDGQVDVVCTATQAELLTYGVPQGRTEMIRFDEAEMRRTHPGRMRDGG